jgi:hypothetical protein
MYWRAGQLGLIPATNQSIRVISLVCVLAAGIGPSWPTLQCWMQGVQGSKAGISAEFSWVVVVYKGPPWLCLTWATCSENALPLGLYLTLKTTLEAVHNFNIRPLASLQGGRFLLLVCHWGHCDCQECGNWCWRSWSQMFCSCSANPNLPGIFRHYQLMLSPIVDTKI